MNASRKTSGAIVAPSVLASVSCTFSVQERWRCSVQVFNINRPPQLSVYTGPPISLGKLFQLGLYSRELNFQNWATMQNSENTPQTELPSHLGKTENFGFL